MTTQDEAAVIFLKRLAITLGVEVDALNSEVIRQSSMKDDLITELSQEQKLAKEKQILDSLRLLKAFLAIDDERARLDVLEFAEKRSRKDTDPSANV